ncbi:MAG: phosphatidylserine decarboxylase family protein [Deltaproteobacteria bacterium]|nr:phosphatidylserine decarboxylase family protein [Deltaproteobacteria bacterium]MBW1816891.1 phosphatidylserine decarboxylase family protein [Deltaproteobacteria bacterium]MBW2284924.1 phosphatidylserine decarboxylase family protein [Deltaproteobacteria bacterium]
MPFILPGIAITFLLYYFKLPYLAFPAALLTLFSVYFFRDPRRVSDARADAVLAPADGTVISVKEIDNDRNPLGEPAVKTSIFMSVFNVHINRIPVSGTIRQITHRPGKFFAANLEKASEQNESNRILMETKDSRRIAFIQIAGLIARRIACWVEEREQASAGQRFGLIRFGSRVDLYLPLGSRMVIELHQRVKAGETIIGYLS